MGKCYNHLTLNDRLTIEKLLRNTKKKYNKREIANIIGCSPSTITREIKKGTIKNIDTNLKEIDVYCGDTSHRITKERQLKQGAKKKAINDKELMCYIEKMILINRYSPRAIAETIKRNKMKFLYTISDYTIYRYIKQNVFKNITMASLPYEKTYHKKYCRIQKRASFGESIEKRPKSVLTREEFGHWEIDSVEGSKGDSKKSLLVFSERKTRKELIFMVDGMETKNLIMILDYIERRLKKFFHKIFVSATMDNGKEFADVEGIIKSKFTNNERIKVYYCHPATPQERGTNENINKMIRKFIPKGINFDDKSDEDISFIQENINNYPRRIFNYNTANDMFRKELNKLKVPKKIKEFFCV